MWVELVLFILVAAVILAVLAKVWHREEEVLRALREGRRGVLPGRRSRTAHRGRRCATRPIHSRLGNLVGALRTYSFAYCSKP